MPLHLETQVEEELRNLQNSGHITKLEKRSNEFFIFPIVITVKKGKSIKIPMDSKTINKAIHKNKYQMHKTDRLMDSIAQTITQSSNGEVVFLTIDLRYAYSQLPVDEETANQCNLNIIGGEATGTYQFKNGFYGLPAEFFNEFFRQAGRIPKSHRENIVRPNEHNQLDNIITVTGGGLKIIRKNYSNA